MRDVRPGAPVKLLVPENPRLDGALATVQEVTEWGARVFTEAAATGKFRAAWHEMVAVEVPRKAIRTEFTGDACTNCGSFRMRRTGTCKTCEDCGTNEGCG